MSAVKFFGVVALLGRFPALTGIDLTVEVGETVLVKGANGAGKSTLLALCAGLLSPTSGEATVLGHNLSSERQLVRRRVALLGHKTGLYDDLTITENVTFWSRAIGLNPVEADKRAHWALDRLDLEGPLASQPVRTLSAGQRRRASLASLVVRRPDLWLLDEPYAGLDKTGREIVDNLISDVVIAGATVIISSHQWEWTTRISPRVLILAGGNLVGDSQEVVRDA